MFAGLDFGRSCRDKVSWEEEIGALSVSALQIAARLSVDRNGNNAEMIALVRDIFPRQTQSRSLNRVQKAQQIEKRFLPSLNIFCGFLKTFLSFKLQWREYVIKSAATSTKGT